VTVTTMNVDIDMTPISGQEESNDRSVESPTEEGRKGRSSGSDRSLQEGLIRWMGTRMS